MSEAFHHGGWGMFPTTFFGLVLLAAAIQYARNPNRRRALVLRHLNVLVGLTATLGFAVGVLKTFMNMTPDEPHIAFIGVGESLNNIGLGLCILVLARIITAIGASRDADSAAHLVDPRAP